MSAELVHDVGAELARLEADWKAANAEAASALQGWRPGDELKGVRLAQLERAEARAASLALRYRSLLSG
jgi:hypothetical protein